MISYPDQFPGFLKDMISIGILLAAAFIAGIILNTIFSFFLKRHRDKKQNIVSGAILKHLRAPFYVFIPLLLLLALTSFYKQVFTDFPVFAKISLMLFYFAFMWLLLRSVNALSEIVQSKFEISEEDNLKQRKVQTQLQFIRKLLKVLIIFIIVSLALLSFESVRKLGAGLLTSAGIAGVILGFAAQKSISNLLAGLQLAFSQPIRIDDVVIVEGEWGKVEEISLTYVVVRIWDLRRLIVPLNYFIEKPFQNWTRTSAQILGSVMIYADYHLPVDKVRAELTRLLDGNPLWDGEVNSVQVTNSTDRTIEVRALVSAENSSDAWNLRCQVRERLIDFIRINYPECLPRIRAEIEQKSHSNPPLQ